MTHIMTEQLVHQVADWAIADKARRELAVIDQLMAEGVLYRDAEAWVSQRDGYQDLTRDQLVDLAKERKAINNPPEPDWDAIAEYGPACDGNFNELGEVCRC